MLIFLINHFTKRRSARSHIQLRKSKTPPNFLAFYFGVGEHMFIWRIFGVSCRFLFSPLHASFLRKKSFSRYLTASLMSSKLKDFSIGRKSSNNINKIINHRTLKWLLWPVRGYSWCDMTILTTPDKNVTKTKVVKCIESNVFYKKDCAYKEVSQLLLASSGGIGVRWENIKIGQLELRLGGCVFPLHRFPKDLARSDQ